MSIMLDVKPIEHLVTDACWDVAIRTIFTYHNIPIWDKADNHSPWAIYAKICRPQNWEQFKELVILSKPQFAKRRPKNVSSSTWEHVYKLLPDIPGQERKTHGYMRGLLYDYLKTHGFTRCPPPHWKTGKNTHYIENLLRSYGPIYCSTPGSLYYDGFESHSNVIFAVHDTKVYFREGSTSYLNSIHNDAYLNAVERSIILQRFNRIVNHDDLYYYHGKKGTHHTHKLKEKKNNSFIQSAHEAKIRMPKPKPSKFPISGRCYFRYTTPEEIDYIQKAFLKVHGKHYSREDVKQWIQKKFFQ